MKCLLLKHNNACIIRLKLAIIAATTMALRFTRAGIEACWCSWEDDVKSSNIASNLAEKKLKELRFAA